MKRPAQSLELLLAQAIPIPGSVAGMISGAIALDGHTYLPGAVG